MMKKELRQLAWIIPFASIGVLVGVLTSLNIYLITFFTSLGAVLGFIFSKKEGILKKYILGMFLFALSGTLVGVVCDVMIGSSGDIPVPFRFTIIGVVTGTVVGFIFTYFTLAIKQYFSK